MRLVPGDTPIFPRRICVTPPAPPSNDTAPSPPNTAKSLHAPILSEDKDESTSQLGVDNPVSVVLGEALALPLPLADAKGVSVLVSMLDEDGLPVDELEPVAVDDSERVGENVLLAVSDCVVVGVFVRVGLDDAKGDKSSNSRICTLWSTALACL